MTKTQAEKELKILSAITKIHRSIGVNLELKETSDILVKELVDMMNCDGCAILFIEGKKVKVLAERGFAKLLGDKELTTDLPAIKHILHTKKSIYTGDLMVSPMASCVPTGCAMNSLICTPVIVNDQVKAIIHLDSPDKNAFDEKDLHLVELLSKEISIVIERSLLYTQIKALSLKDSLTNCFNRLKLDEDIESETDRAKRYQRPLSLLMIDIDRFKHYNDFYGHSTGDLLLKKVARLLRQNVRKSDKVYRYGGDEFVVLLPETNTQKALILAERIKEIINQVEFKTGEKNQINNKITISIGLATFIEDTDDPEVLFKSADKALYQAKQTGRNKVVIFSRRTPSYIELESKCLSA